MKNKIRQRKQQSNKYNKMFQKVANRFLFFIKYKL
jgi:hypothetical protein